MPKVHSGTYQVIFLFCGSERLQNVQPIEFVIVVIIGRFQLYKCVKVQLAAFTVLLYIRSLQVESWNLPLWVIREGNRLLNYTDELSNPQDEEHKKLVEAFEKGIAESYIRTPLKSGFVVAEVNDIANPNTINKVIYENFYRIRNSQHCVINESQRFEFL